MNAKYCKNSNPLVCHFKTSDSRVWKSLCKIKWEAENYIQWGIGIGEVAFSQYNWLGTGSIDNYLNTHTIVNTRVNEFFYNGEWNIPKLQEVVPFDIVEKIIQIPLQLQVKDKILFMLSSSGNFFLKRIWDETRIKGEVDKTFKCLWHKSIPLSYSLLAWRCLKGFVPIDNILWNKGFIVVSKCQCCLNIESLHHVFVNGSIASKVWPYFFNVADMGLLNANLDLAGILKLWFTDSKGHINNILHIVIIWYLWNSRNEAKHLGIKMNAYDIISKVRFKILQLKAVNLISIKSFTKSCSLADHFGIYKEDIHSNRESIVKWSKPNDPYVKLNTDGSVHANKAGIGGIIRDSQGNPLAIFLGPMSTCSVLTSELNALYHGLQICLRLGLQNVNIEVDCTLVVHIFSKNDLCFPQDFYTIRKIRMALSLLNFTISHIYREGNACADWLANFGAESENFLEYSVYDIPVPLKGMIILDKTGLPYIRH
ncbi:uncharacterized protein LOC110098095 [Dendrobium catenatum]|uniref:uncharacterized protein LOC110098095 n=1 Tax=Dendrobium catenatum TaxID=906689 RepID=UPI00109F2346|nr:uncharacterized protein LOC110098095 [Dendrobium catenatum]